MSSWTFQNGLFDGSSLKCKLKRRLLISIGAKSTCCSVVGALLYTRMQIWANMTEVTKFYNSCDLAGTWSDYIENLLTSPFPLPLLCPQFIFKKIRDHFVRILHATSIFCVFKLVYCVYLFCFIYKKIFILF